MPPSPSANGHTSTAAVKRDHPDSHETPELNAPNASNVQKDRDASKREDEEPSESQELKEPATKKRKIDPSEGAAIEKDKEETEPHDGTLERGHIYFFYRPKVQHDEAHSLDDVASFYILLVPRPASHSSIDKEEESVVPTAEPVNESKKRFRLIVVGKKRLPQAPTEEEEESGKIKGRKEMFWAAVEKVGDSLDNLEEGLAESNYETKTSGSRHIEPARLAGRGAYTLVSPNPHSSAPSARTTFLAYALSHPDPSSTASSSVQETFGILPSGSFIVQVKNPHAPNTFGARNDSGKSAEYPQEIMQNVFGADGVNDAGGGKIPGTNKREKYGVKWVAADPVGLLDYEGAELLLMEPKRGKEAGLGDRIGDESAEALTKEEKKDADELDDEDVLAELNFSKEEFTTQVLKGHWI